MQPDVGDVADPDLLWGRGDPLGDEVGIAAKAMLTVRRSTDTRFWTSLEPQLIHQPPNPLSPSADLIGWAPDLLGQATRPIGRKLLGSCLQSLAQFTFVAHH